MTRLHAQLVPDTRVSRDARRPSPEAGDIVDHADVVDPVGMPLLGALAGGAQIADVGFRGVFAAIGQVPPGRRRRRLNADRREQAYLRFQIAATDCAITAEFQLVLAEAVPSILLQVLNTPGLIRETSQASRVFGSFLAALHEIRMVGNPQPRAIAEEVAALLGELYERAPRTRRPKRVRAQEDARFLECQRTLGDAHRRFTLAARRDLGYGARWYRRRGPRWWTRSEHDWPGGWPGPDPLALIQAEQERSTR
jgi:hypothetical protein